MYYRNIKVLCAMKGLTLSELADKSGVALSCFSKWKNDKTIPKLSSLLKVADALGVSVEELVRKN